MTTEADLTLGVIRLDGGTQCRAELHQDYIGNLAEEWAAGAKMPRIVVYHDGTNYWLADGFHRYHAAQKCGHTTISSEVRSGTRTDAVKFALSANAQHGVRRTNADKRRAVEIALKEFSNLSSAELGRICAVSHHTVEAARTQLGDLPSSPRTGADGKTRKPPTRKPKPESKTDTTPDVPPSNDDDDPPPSLPPDTKPDLSRVSEARQLWIMAKASLDNIRRKDTERVDVLRGVIAYAQQRLDRGI